VSDGRSFYDLLFETECGLSERFPSLNPVVIRKTPAHEIFLLMKRLAKYVKSSPKISGSGKRVIRRPAGDDWF